jgi:biopolymer transport protein ExbD
MARKKRKAPGINATSSADIAFMLLIFFLITTSMDTDKGLARRLPPPVPKDQKKNEEMDIKKRNIMVVLINSNNQILCNNEPIDIKQLKEKVRTFIENPYNDEHMPEKTEVDVPFFGKQMVTKNHVISLQNDRGTEYQAYIDVQNELARAYNELRDEVSKKKFGKKFADLDEEQQKAVQMIYPQKISEAEPKNYGDKK